MSYDKNKFYSDMKNSFKEAEPYKSKGLILTNTLRAELKASREHGHAMKEKINSNKKRMKEFEEQIKHLKYDNANLKDDNRALKALVNDLKNDLVRLKTEHRNTK